MCYLLPPSGLSGLFVYVSTDQLHCPASLLHQCLFFHHYLSNWYTVGFILPPRRHHHCHNYQWSVKRHVLFEISLTIVMVTWSQKEVIPFFWFSEAVACVRIETKIASKMKTITPFICLVRNARKQRVHTLCCAQWLHSAVSQQLPGCTATEKECNCICASRPLIDNE